MKKIKESVVIRKRKCSKCHSIIEDENIFYVGDDWTNAYCAVCYEGEKK